MHSLCSAQGHLSIGHEAFCAGRQLLYTAHVGDSGAILVRDGEAARLTEDHKPTLHRESERIRERGGQIHDKSNRVMSGTESERTHLLAMSRRAAGFWSLPVEVSGVSAT